MARPGAAARTRERRGANAGRSKLEHPELAPAPAAPHFSNMNRGSSSRRQFTAALLFALTSGIFTHGAEPAPPPVALRKVGEFHLLTARMGAAAVARENFIYVLGGTAAGIVTDIERFDPRTPKSIQIFKDLLPRRFHSVVEHEGRLYIFGGQGDVAASERFEERVEIFDCATGTVTRGPRMPVARASMACVKLGTNVHLIGGSKVVERSGRGVVQASDHDIFDLVTGKWTKGAPMPTPRETSGVAVGSFIFTAGGFRAERVVDTVEVYDPAANAWRGLPALPRKVSAHATVFLGQHAFLIGDYDRLDSVVAYDLKTRTAVDVRADFKGARHTTAVVLRDTIFVIGGKTEEIGGETDLIQAFQLAR